MPVESKVRRVGRPKGLTLAQDFGQACREALEGLGTITFPCAQYQTDIIGFAQDVVGYHPCYTIDELVAIRDDEEARGVPEHERRRCLWPKQIEILIAIQNAVSDPTRRRVAVASGHKISKSHTAAIAGLWFYSSFSDAKVVFSSTTYHQVQSILWDEFKKTRQRSKLTIPGDMHQLAASGFVSEDFRSARGFTAREPEAVAGISGKNLLFILDEASGIADAIHEAVGGNMAGGAALVMFSNPTRTTGTFFDAFNSKSEFYDTYQVSSEETPNAQTGRRLIPGLATRAFVEEMRAEWGEDSSFYKIRVKGEFVLSDDAKPFSLALIQEAEERWHDLPAEGRLHIGVDPAGPADGGDEYAFCARRGNKVVATWTKAGYSEQDAVTKIEEWLTLYSPANEISDQWMPVVAIDREGPIGYSLWVRLRTAFEAPSHRPIRLVGVRASDKAQRRPDLYDRLRDELWGNLEAWLKAGGALITDVKLEKELHTIEWSQTLQGRLKATPKDDIRKILGGRSPDRADALALAVWEPSNHRAVATDAAPAASAQLKRTPLLDPYSGGIDPYG